MNTNRLAKMYDRLNPKERWSLIVSACHRGDAEEWSRLVRAANRVVLTVPDYHVRAEAVEKLALRYVARQQELILAFHHLAGMLDFVDEWPMLRYLAYLFIVNADGWEAFARELVGVAPPILLKDLPGGEWVRQLEPVMRDFAFGADEAADYLRQRNSPKDRAVTQDEIAKAFRSALANLVPAGL